MEIEGCEIILGLSLILHAILDIYRHSDLFLAVACQFLDKKFFDGNNFDRGHL